LKILLDNYAFKMFTRYRMATSPQLDISRQMLETVVTQLSFALNAAKDVPSDVKESGEKFLAALKKWSEKKGVSTVKDGIAS